jgi:hypothetical protein
MTANKYLGIAAVPLYLYSLYLLSIKEDFSSIIVEMLLLLSVTVVAGLLVAVSLYIELDSNPKIRIEGGAKAFSIGVIFILFLIVIPISATSIKNYLYCDVQGNDCA